MAKNGFKYQQKPLLLVFHQIMPPIGTMNSQSIYPKSNLDPHVWTIAIALPDARQRTIGRFCNRQDAEDHLRVLRRFVPSAKFEIIFNPPEQALADNALALPKA
ncbi:hypothetical protein [Microseira sp. BLCC-F43]|jgi:hypothetical protein|uniref:hypothetical protein n=1 Tax=Microseira sp. BLCC-F43 TaxID=3153602 RepID=UPI0035B98742